MQEKIAPLRPKHVDDVLQLILKRVAPTEPFVRHWEIATTPEGLRVDVNFDGEEIVLAIRPRDGAIAFAKTRSLAINIACNDNEFRLNPRAEKFLRLVVTLLQRTDRGNLFVPQIGAAGAARKPRFSSEAQAHEALSEKLRYAAFIGWKAITTEDLYPHTQALGDIVGAKEIVAGWERTLKRIEEGRAPEKLGLYIHIPYCATCCEFCYCAKTDRFARGDLYAYVDRLIDEIELFRPTFAKARFTSVYFGGGTPSILNAELLKRLITTLYDAFEVPDGTQVVFEGNPDTLNEQKIQILAELGRVSRLTIGVQTLDAETQKRARRFNKHEHVSEAVEAARKFGIPHVNIDLMAGMDGQTFDAFKNDLNFVLSLQPDSLNINGFRPLARTIWTSKGNEMGSEQIELRDAMITWGRERLSEFGLIPQRGVDPARTRLAANIQEYDLRRQNSSLLGLGHAARSHAFGSYFYSSRVGSDFDASLREQIEEERRWTAVPVDIRAEQQKFLIENLVTGFSCKTFKKIFGVDPWDVERPVLENLENLGVLRRSGDTVYSYPGKSANVLMYRSLFYSGEVLERMHERWASEYDPSIDYRARLEHLVGGQ